MVLRLDAKQSLDRKMLVEKRLGAVYERYVGAGWNNFSLAGSGLCDAVGHPEDHTPPPAFSAGRCDSARPVVPAVLTTPKLSVLG